MNAPEQLVQGSEAWKLARLGSVGASRIADLMAKTKSGWGASRANLMAELLVERLTGTPTESYINAAMQHGIDTEPKARNEYQFWLGLPIEEVGLVLHPRIPNSHASPDGLVRDDGMVEIKCPMSATHLATVLGGSAIPEKYVLQCQWQMACTGRAWVDWVSFDPRFPEGKQLFIRRIKRDDKRIAELEEEVRVFLQELDSKIASLARLAAHDMRNVG